MQTSGKAPQSSTAGLLEQARLAREGGRLEEAEQACRRAVELDPDSVEARWKLGAVQHERGDSSVAEATLRAALAIAPDNLEALLTLATVLCALRRPEDAVAPVVHATEVAPGAAIVHANLGRVLAQCGREDEAAAAYARALELKPGYAEARWNLAQVLLGLGRYPEGWQMFEARWQLAKYARQRPAVPFPQWSGEDLRGKRLFVHSEQGFGDTMQFLRFVEPAAERGAEVVLHVPKALLKLAATLRGVARLDVLGAPVPACDYVCPVMSLPRGFGTTVETIPCRIPYFAAEFGTTVETIPCRIPYFAADASAVAAWRRRLDPDAALHVGLVWASGISPALGKGFAASARARSLPLAALGALGSVRGARFYSLQKGPPAAETAAPPAGLRLLDWSDELHDFLDTAALVCALDLVITCDTSISHLAGALGKPVWVLVNKPPSWRWLRNRDDSPWYPTMRLFRQASEGDWSAPVAALAAALGSSAPLGATR